MKEAIRYLHNAEEILRKIPREGRTYLDVKPVREACGTAYLAILEAIKEYLLGCGLTKKELPKSTDGYRHALRKYIATHNGKLSREFEKLYDALHIAGYYQGLLYDVKALRDYFTAAQEFITKITK